VYGRYINRPIIQNHDSDDGWEWGEAHRICLREAFHFTKVPSEAEDIAQDALLRAWRYREKLRDKTRLKEWLTSIVRREAFREFERVRPDPIGMQMIELKLEKAVDDEHVVETVEQADIRAAIGRLSEREQQLLRLRYDEDLTESAISRRLSIPEGTVKVRLHRARHKLRRAIGR
jgi:RNA polymerase sigma-70 factor (ECF subfamily)